MPSPAGQAEELQRIVKTFRLSDKTLGTDRADAIHDSEETRGLAFAHQPRGRVQLTDFISRDNGCTLTIY